MISWIAVMAQIQGYYEKCCRATHRVRRGLIRLLKHLGGHDMLLLKDGHWVDARVVVPEESIAWAYCSEKHVLTAATSAPGTRMTRWPWLSVIHNGQDISEFFVGLRLSTGHDLSVAALMRLFAHQKGWMPLGELHVTDRMGMDEVVQLDGSDEEEEENVVLGADATEIERRVSGVNYIR
jgi:hypothetical protein